ncbi:MAG: hypothetical protein PVH41_18990 [Anaerolineae bacterium]
MNEHELRRLEARLAEDPALRAELEALRQTVSLVRELPRVAAPRNLILTHSMVEGRRGTRAAQTRAGRPRSGQAPARAWAAPVLTAATAVASLLFAVVLTGDLLLGGIGGLASVPESMQEAKEIPQIAFEAGRDDEAGAADEEATADESLQVEREVAPSPPTTGARSAEAPPAEPEAAVEEKEAVQVESEGVVSPTPAPPAVAGAPADALEMAAEEVGEAGASPVAEPVEEELAAEHLLQTETPSAPMGGGEITEEPATPAIPEAQPTEVPVAISGAAVTPTNALEAPTVPEATTEGEAWRLEASPEEVDATSAPIRADETGSARPVSRKLPLRVLEGGLGLTVVALAFATVQAWRARRR